MSIKTNNIIILIIINAYLENILASIFLIVSSFTKCNFHKQSLYFMQDMDQQSLMVYKNFQTFFLCRLPKSEKFFICNL